ncbi:MAG: AAA domain-containing protein [Candidatus Thorarchaeota archaeon]
MSTGSAVKLDFVGLETTYGTAHAGMKSNEVMVATSLRPNVGSRVSIVRAGNLALLEMLKSSWEAFHRYSRTDEPNGIFWQAVLSYVPNLTLPQIRFELAGSDLNNSQKRAVETALSLSDESPFFLIHGPPGTGKTRVIGEIVSHLVEKQNDCRVLITSHTNVAVDNAIETFWQIAGKKAQGKTIRLGPLQKVARAVRKRHITAILQKSGGISDGLLVYGCTLSKLLFLDRRNPEQWRKPLFDYVIVDESSMCTVPQAVCAAMAGKRIIFVGDHRQLPPIVDDSLGRSVYEEVRLSLFERLVTCYPKLRVLLNTQYRSNKAIMEWSNLQFYSGRLRTDPSVASIRLDFNSVDDSVWTRILANSVPIVWIDTRELGRADWRELSTGPSAVNQDEAAVVVRILGALGNAGVPRENIAVISLFRAQAEILRYVILLELGINPSVSDLETLVHDYEEDEDDLEEEIMRIVANPSLVPCSTVDSFQGHEADVVILDLVINDWSRVLEEERRLNVAITRARKKVIIIGSSDICKWSKTYGDLLDYVKNRGRLIPLDRNTLDPELVKRMSTRFVQALARIEVAHAGALDLVRERRRVSSVSNASVILSSVESIISRLLLWKGTLSLEDIRVALSKLGMVTDDDVSLYLGPVGPRSFASLASLFARNKPDVAYRGRTLRIVERRTRRRRAPRLKRGVIRPIVPITGPLVPVHVSRAAPDVVWDTVRGIDEESGGLSWRDESEVLDRMKKLQVDPTEFGCSSYEEMIARAVAVGRVTKCLFGGKPRIRRR